MKNTSKMIAIGALAASGMHSGAWAQSVISDARLDQNVPAPQRAASERGAQIVYEEDFEDGFTTGPVDGQNDWTATTSAFQIGQDPGGDPVFGNASLIFSKYNG